MLSFLNGRMFEFLPSEIPQSPRSQRSKKELAFIDMERAPQATAGRTEAMRRGLSTTQEFPRFVL